MIHLKSYDLYNEGLINWIRSKRFKDDDIVQNLIKIINKTNIDDINISIEANDNPFDVNNRDFFFKKVKIFNVFLSKENLNFKIIDAKNLDINDLSHLTTDEYPNINQDDVNMINIKPEFTSIIIDDIKMDNVSKKTTNTLIKLLESIFDNKNKSDFKKHKDETEDLKSTLRKELKFKANK